jgi:ABC-type bacteriocin/lantibiotic exporter with double-glycine peptidase domain
MLNHWTRVNNCQLALLLYIYFYISRLSLTSKYLSFLSIAVLSCYTFFSLAFFSFFFFRNVNNAQYCYKAIKKEYVLYDTFKRLYTEKINNKTKSNINPKCGCFC